MSTETAIDGLTCLIRISLAQNEYTLTAYFNIEEAFHNVELNTIMDALDIETSLRKKIVQKAGNESGDEQRTNANTNKRVRG